MDTVATRLGEMDSIILLTKLFVIDIRRGALLNPSRVAISPDNGRATGPGIPPDNRNLLFEKFAIEVNGSNFLNGTASSRNSIEFEKALDIRWMPPIAINPETAITIDLEDLGIKEGEVSLDGSGNIVLLISEDGSQAVGELRVVEEVVVPLEEAIVMEKPLEEIDAEFVENLEEVAEFAGAGETTIASDVESNGRLINQQTFSNCDCSDPTLTTFTTQFTRAESINIDFPANATNAEISSATARLQTIVGTNGEGDESVSLSIALDNCQSKTVTSQEIVRTVTGTVLGFPFSYEGTDRLETTETISDCPTTSPCHQGCPG